MKWDQPVPYSIKSYDSPYVFDTTMNFGANQPSSVIAKGDTLFAAGLKIYYTTNGGESWYFPANNGYSGYGSKLFVEGNRLYMFAIKAFGQPCSLFYSDDNAENWTEVDVSSLTQKKEISGQYFYPTAFFIKGLNIWFAAGMEKFNTPPNIYKSSDFGATWMSDTIGLKSSYVNGATNFAYTEDGYIWVVPSYNNIFKQKIAVTSGIELRYINNSSVEMSPNPAAEFINITDIDFTPEIIYITNSLGIEIKRIENNKLLNNNCISISTSYLESGFYYLTLASGNKTITKNFVIVR